MIYESKFWKDDLLKQAKNLWSRVTQKRWTENSFARLEQTVMLGFYSIRKLIEAKKLSDLVANQDIEVFVYKSKDEPVTRINKSRIGKLYDFNDEQVISKSLIFFCNQFVHSYVFEIAVNENNCLDGIFASSDRERNQALYYIKIHKLINIFEQVGSDYPARVCYIANLKTLDYDVKAWSDSSYKEI